MKWFKKLFHKHEVVWTSRVLIERVSIDYTTCGVIDIQEGSKYLYTGYCASCGNKGLQSIITVADIFDKVQPYDN